MATAEVDPKTMESRLASGLYLACELLDVDGPIGATIHKAVLQHRTLGRITHAQQLKPCSPLPNSQVHDIRLRVPDSPCIRNHDYRIGRERCGRSSARPQHSWQMQEKILKERNAVMHIALTGAAKGLHWAIHRRLPGGTRPFRCGAGDGLRATWLGFITSRRLKCVSRGIWAIEPLQPS